MKQSTHTYAEMTDAPTEFTLWMRKVGMGSTQAADALGVTQRLVNYYMRGQKVPMVPTRKLMALIAKGADTSEAWPE